MRVHIRIRGMLLAEISKKSLLLNQSEAKKADSLTLMNTDIETVLYAVSYPHKVCPQILELAANVYILSTIVKQASFLFAIPVVGKSPKCSSKDCSFSSLQCSTLSLTNRPFPPQ